MSEKYSLKIGAHNMKLRYVRHHEIDATYGEYSPMDNEIRIVLGMEKSHTLSTIIHEVLHRINEKLDEVTIEFLAQSITQFLLDNDLIKDGNLIPFGYLTSKLSEGE